MSVLICFALKEEAAPFRKIAADKSGITILVTGIGRQNAEQSLREFLLDWGARASGAHRQASRLPEYARIETIHAASETGALPELVLTCGFAGGLNPDLKLGEVIFEFSNWRDEFHESQTEKEAKDLIGDSLELVPPRKTNCRWRKAIKNFLRRSHSHNRRRQENIAQRNRRGRRRNGIGGDPRNLSRAKYSLRDGARDLRHGQ